MRQIHGHIVRMKEREIISNMIPSWYHLEYIKVLSGYILQVRYLLPMCLNHLFFKHMLREKMHFMTYFVSSRYWKTISVRHFK